VTNQLIRRRSSNIGKVWADGVTSGLRPPPNPHPSPRHTTHTSKPHTENDRPPGPRRFNASRTSKHFGSACEWETHIRSIVTRAIPDLATTGSVRGDTEIRKKLSADLAGRWDCRGYQRRQPKNGRAGHDPLPASTPQADAFPQLIARRAFEERGDCSWCWWGRTKRRRQGTNCLEGDIS